MTEISLQHLVRWYVVLILSLIARSFVTRGQGNSLDSLLPWSRISRLEEQKNVGNDVKTYDLLSLDSIRSTLIRQEETIIFALIERAQYRRNYAIYDPKAMKLRNVYGTPLSFLEYMLIETEKLHAKVRRYTSPEEHPFFESLLPQPILMELNYPTLLSVRKSDVDVNPEILRWYEEKIIDRLCFMGDDEQYGSSVLCDITALQALSRRIHYGKFVAESKYLSSPDVFERLVVDNDVQGILKELTNIEVERNVLRRAFVKASHYGKDITAAVSINNNNNRDDTTTSTNNSSSIKTSEGFKIDPLLIADIYRDMIIPLTKDVEVRYIYRRLGRVPPSPDHYYQACRGPLDAFDDLEELKKFNFDVSDGLLPALQRQQQLPKVR